MPLKVAVLIPCYNEEASISEVVEEAKKVLPLARIYVYDNNSNDKTAELARAAGATVRTVLPKGKGNVVRRMFADIEADVYVLLDGDLTYDISATPSLIEKLVREQKDMVVGTRMEQTARAYRFGHKIGNTLLTSLVQVLFGIEQTDMLSGFRVFSRRFVKVFPAKANSFQVETEFNIFAKIHRFPFAEIKTRYFSRPEGSSSKLSTIKDGFKILFFILESYMSEFPIYISILFAVIFSYFSLDKDIPVRVCSYLAYSSLACIVTGLFVSLHASARREQKKIVALMYPFPTEESLERFETFNQEEE